MRANNDDERRALVGWDADERRALVGWDDDEEEMADVGSAVAWSPDKSTSGSQALGAAIDAVGAGPFQWLAALLLGFGNAADAVELTSVSFILPQWHLISAVDKGYLSAAVFLGMLIGSLGSGLLSDRFGRKGAVVSCLAINALFGLCSAFSPGWLWFLSFRVLSGVGVGGSAGLVFTLLAEFLPVAGRGFFLTVVAWFWMVGSIYAAGFAWIMLGVLQLSWRWYAVVSMLPAACGAALVLLWVPESPRWLLLRGRHREAVAVLRHVAAFNGRTADFAPFDAFFARPDVRSWLLASMASEQQRRERLSSESSSSSSQSSSSVVAAVRSTLLSLGRLFHAGVVRTTTLLAVVFWALSYGWYGLTMWIPTILDELALPINAYESSFFVTAATLPGNIVSALIVDRVGRKNLLVGSMLLAGLSAIGFAFAERVDSTAYTITVAMLFNCLGTMGWNALDCISAELFPTEIRNTGLGFVMAFGRLASLTSQLANGALIQTSMPAMLGLIAVNILAGCVAAFFLAEPKGVQLTDTIV